jgi:hypothetical protein
MDVCGGIKAVHFRHLDVHQNEVERLLLQGGQRFLAVGGQADLVPFLRQQNQRQPLIQGVIFHHQDAERPIDRAAVEVAVPRCPDAPPAAR